MPAFIRRFLQGNPVKGRRDSQIAKAIEHISNGFQQKLFEQFLYGIKDDVMLRREDGDAGLSVADVAKGFQGPDSPGVRFLTGNQGFGSLRQVRC